MERVWLSLGSNLHNPILQVNLAIKNLARMPKSNLIRHSSYYRSRPFGFKNQPDFLNAVVIIDTNLSPEQLMNQIKLIELYHGRIRNGHRFGPRTLDIDILLFGNRKIDNNFLTIPHYDMYNREFMLYPLAELEPNLIFPDGISILDKISRISSSSITYWQE